MWDFYREKKHENVWVVSVKNGKNIDRDSENQHGNVCITTQDTKLVRINDAEEGWAYSKGSKCIQKKNPPPKTLDLSQPEKAKGKHTQQQIRMQTSLPDLRPASLRFPPCWLFVVAALGCSEISSQQTTKTDFQQQFVRFLKEGCELNESHCNARTRPHPPRPLLVPQQWSYWGTQYLSAWCYLSHVKWGDQQSKDKKKSNRRTRGRTGEVEEISFLSRFLSFTLSWSTQIVYSSKGSNTTRLSDWEKKVPDSRCSFRYQTYSE